MDKQQKLGILFISLLILASITVTIVSSFFYLSPIQDWHTQISGSEDFYDGDDLFDCQLGSSRIRIDNSENIYVLGAFRYDIKYYDEDVSNTVIDGSLNKILVSKFDSLGVQKWIKFCLSTSHHGNRLGMTIDTAGNIYIVCNYKSVDYDDADAADVSIVLLKLNPNGDVLWNKTFGKLMTSQYGYDIELDDANNVYVVGDSDGKPILIKFDSSGNHLWNKTISPGQYGVATDIDINRNNDILISGVVEDSLLTKSHFLSNYTEGGVLQWEKSFGTEQGQDYDQAAITIDKNNYTHMIYKSSSGDTSNLYQINYTGEIIWEKSDSTNLSPQFISLDNESNIYVASGDEKIISFDSEGNKLNEYTWGYRPLYAGSFDALCIDSSNNLYTIKNGILIKNPGTIINLISIIPNIAILIVCGSLAYIVIKKKLRF